jgi:hypothetical protein
VDLLLSEMRQILELHRSHATLPEILQQIFCRHFCVTHLLIIKHQSELQPTILKQIKGVIVAAVRLAIFAKHPGANIGRSLCSKAQCNAV